MDIRVVREGMMDIPDLGGPGEPVNAWVGLEADERAGTGGRSDVGRRLRTHLPG